MVERLFALLLLIIFCPVMILISIMIFIISGRPILFKHRRCGFNYKEFNVLKFRTMHINNGSDITKYNDKRITKIGKMLRTLKIDEFPQLINIVRGQMVFIGPRPEAASIVNNNKDYFSYLNIIKPGITDVGSVVFRNETNLDIMYDADKYNIEILPLKYKLVNCTLKNYVFSRKLILFITSIISIINHKLALYIISHYFLTSEEELRNKLNSLFSHKIF